MPDASNREVFARFFDAAPDAVDEAPGRVNLLGEHTDYHGGLVLPTVLPLTTSALIRRRSDMEVRAVSTAVHDTVVTFSLGREQVTTHWIDYVQGVTALLARNGAAVSGFDLLIASTIPIGAGVSSSAALVVAVLRALRRAFELDVDDLGLASLAHKVETDFVGAPVGFMDPMVCSLGRAGEALFLDTRTLKFDYIALPPAVELVVIDSGITHRHVSGKYAQRRQESFHAADALGVSCLSDLEIHDLPRLRELPPLLARRARHVLTENQRVRDAVVALRGNDPVRLGDLFNASHASMRDDYEISTPEIDELILNAQSHPAVYGARMTGGGFGGAIVILARQSQGPAVAAHVLGDYRRHEHGRGAVLMPAG